MKIAVAGDHGGFLLKKSVIDYLREKNYTFWDYGTQSEESVDYPDYAILVAKAVARGDYDRGILICGTGIGVNITANKVPGIRAAQCHDTYSARMSREHNDANVLTMGGRVIGPGLAAEIVETFLQGKYDGGRHSCRVAKITEIEKMLLDPTQSGQ